MTKLKIYHDVAKQIAAVMEGEPSHTARYATAACLLFEAFDYYFWTGFYLVDLDKPGELVIGPYQGSLGCLRIPFGKGVCGAAAQSGKTVMVNDVHAFPGHIACDSRSHSEIVVPIYDVEGKLAAVLDVDSLEIGSFDAEDKAGLESICKTLLA